jgi:predicted DNA-binding transcriptional regulator YafY
MMTVNRKRKFTVKELAEEFNVSRRTILRDLQELSGLGVPLYSEVGPHGGYQVLNERILPPIAFTEEEAVSIFFASHALRHFSSLPFETEISAALKKFYFYMPGDVRDRIDQMKNRFDFISPTRQAKSPYLSLLLEAAVHQKVVHIDYESKSELTSRKIQPIGIYASVGLWYCPSYCFTRDDFRLFRCDKIHSAKLDESVKPIDLTHIHLGNRQAIKEEKHKKADFFVELSREGVQRCESDLSRRFIVNVREDGTGWIEDQIKLSNIPFFAKYFIGLGEDAWVERPPELIEDMKQRLAKLLEKYKNNFV